jgi:hypothetical protein
MNQVIGLVGVFLPGLCWWAWLGWDDDDPGEALAVIFGVSMAVIALAALLFYLLKLPFGPNKQLAYWVGAPLFLALGLAVRWKKHKFDWKLLLALVFFGGLVAFRLWQARELVLPNWVDSLHHSLIVRKMVEAGGLTASLEPYLPGNFYYHFGFHSFTAVYSLLSKQFAPFAVLFLGQVISAGVSLSIYAFTKTLTRDWKIGLLAALLSAFVTKMPGYYLTWGRYTLLAGMLLMPLAMAFGLKVIRGQRGIGNLLALGVLTAGTLLTHYFNAFLLAVWFVVLGLVWLFRAAKARSFKWHEALGLVLPVMIGLLAVLPWYVRIFQYSGARADLSANLVGLAADRTEQWSYLRYLIGNQLNLVLVIMAGGGVLWCLWRNEKVEFALWALFVGLMSLPIGVQLSSFRHDYFGLVLFFPVSVMAASFVFGVVKFFQEKFTGLTARRISAALASVFMIFVLVYGGWSNRDVINKATILADQDDLDALNWINTHLPKDARFFINTAPWGFGLYRGVDGGAWITPYTGRWSLVPTNFFSFSDNYDYMNQMIDLSKRTASLDEMSNNLFIGLICEANANYIYLKNGLGGITSNTLNMLNSIQKIASLDSVSVWMVSTSIICNK